MIKHLVEAVVNYGEFAAFREAAERYDKLCSDRGLQTYTLWGGTGTGRMNEVYFEATFDDTDAMRARDKAENDIPEIMQALMDIIRHCTPGTIVDHQLETA